MTTTQPEKSRRGRLVLAVGTAAVAVFVPWTLCAVSASSAGADSTDALQARLDALEPGGYLKLSPQVYEHHGVLKVRVRGVHIDGNGATLQSTNDETSAFEISADDVQLTNITLAAPTEGTRFNGLDQHKLVLSGAGMSSSTSRSSVLPQRASSSMEPGASPSATWISAVLAPMAYT